LWSNVTRGGKKAWFKREGEERNEGLIRRKRRSFEEQLKKGVIGKNLSRQIRKEGREEVVDEIRGVENNANRVQDCPYRGSQEKEGKVKSDSRKRKNYKSDKGEASIKKDRKGNPTKRRRRE